MDTGLRLSAVQIRHLGPEFDPNGQAYIPSQDRDRVEFTGGISGACHRHNTGTA